MTDFPATLPCPVTGKPFPSGIEVRGQVGRLTITDSYISCPHCHRNHRIDYPPLLIDGKPPEAHARPWWRFW